MRQFYVSYLSRVAPVAIAVLLFCSQALAQLSGTYTINPAGGDFVSKNCKSFGEAVDSLISQGVGGPVTFNIADGFYTGQYIMSAIPNVSATDTVLFQSASGDSSKVSLIYTYFNDSQKNHIIKIDGADYVTFKGITFNASSGYEYMGRAIYFGDSPSHHINFLNCAFLGKPAATSYDNNTLVMSEYDYNNYIVFKNTLFKDGERAIQMWGNSTSNLATHMVIQNNYFDGQSERCIYLRNQQAPVLDGNEFNLYRWSTDRQIYFQNVDWNFRITNNKFYINNPSYGIYIHDCDGSSGLEGLIANNFIAVNIPSSGANYGIALRIQSSTNQKVYFNTINVYGSWKTDTKAFEQYSGGSNLDVRNNIFKNIIGGYAMYLANSGSTVSDYNDYYSSGNFIAYREGAYWNLAQLQAAGSNDQHSLSVNPVISATALHTTTFQLDGKGDPNTAITDLVPFDIDGEARTPGSPDIGADEFDTPTGAALSGTITVGTGETYETITDVVNVLNNYGVDGPLVINVLENGSPYNEQLSFREIAGADASNTVTLQSDPGNAGEVIVTYNASSSSQTVYLCRASFITLKNLTLSAENASYPEVIRFNGLCHHDSIIGCRLSSVGTNGSVIYSSGDRLLNIYIGDNEIIASGTSISIEGSSSYYFENFEITGNTLVDPYSNGIYLNYLDAPKIRNNVINGRETTYSGYYAIYMDHCRFNYEVMGNEINNHYQDNGIQARNSDGTLGKEGLIANNFIKINGGSGRSASGIYTNGSDYVDIVFNTIRIDYSNDYGEAEAYYNTGGSNINLYNNVFCNYGYGRAIHNNTTGAIANSDYNCFYATDKYLARWGSTECNTLEEWRTASGEDAHSVFADPGLINTADDLHVNSSFLDGTGMAFDTIATDFDGEARSSPPDIGADEFTDPPAPLAGTYTIGGDSPDYATIADARNDLRMRGISAPVTFNIRTGEYEETLNSYYPISGASSKDTIVIQAESGNPEDVAIYSNDQVNMGYFRGARYMTIKDLTISTTNPSGGRSLYFRGYTKNINIVNNILVSSNTSWENVMFNYDFADSILIKDNLISKGNRGIAMYGESGNRNRNTLIIGNIITDNTYAGISLTQNDSPEIYNNDIHSGHSGDVTGISCDYCVSNTRITGNRVVLYRGYGISVSNCDASSPFYGLISNNMVSIRGTYYAGGIYVNSSDRMRVYHNSVHISSTNESYPYCLYLENNNNELEIINNIFAASDGCRVMYIEDINDVTTSDYNELYAVNTSHFIRVGSTDHPDFETYKGAVSHDQHSVSLDPLFYSRDKLYSGQPGLFEAGTPLTDVTIDIDSISRTVTASPDIGAAEFYCETPEFNIEVIPTCFGDSTVFIDKSTKVTWGSTFFWSFDNDWNPELNTKVSGDTVKHLFETSGVQKVKLWISQIAGCTYDTEIDVTVNPLPALEFDITGASCGEDNGKAVITVTEGIGPFKYYWSTGDTDSLVTGLALGTYTVAVSDNNNCTTTQEVVIEEDMQVTVTQLQVSTCGTPTGQAEVTVTGGSPPYRYVWSNGDTLSVSTSLSTGVHYVNVIDADGCYAQGLVNIGNDGTGPQITRDSVLNNVCYGDRLGSIGITITGGTEPYSIKWSNGSSDEDLTNLASGIYDVIVTDATGCIGSDTIKVSQPTRINMDAVVEDASCAGADGKAVAVVSGGVKPYVYSWSTGSIFALEDSLAAGVYSVQVTDMNGCVQEEPVIVNNIGGPIPVIQSVTGVSCLNQNDGAISVLVSGGQGPYTYSWSNAQITSSISNLIPGKYTVTVTDKNGCVGVNFAWIRQDPPDTNAICLVTVDTVGTPKNMVVWEKQNTTDVDYYVIYRETSLKGIYQPIGTSDVTESGTFLDSVADPTVRSWRYKLSVVDKCGVESDLSKRHKTMHLTINLGIDGRVNLIWDHYEGFDVSTYKVWRYSAGAGWENIEDMPADLTSYTDMNPPVEDLTYYIEVLKEEPCTLPDLKAGTLNSSKSNRQSRLKTSEKGILSGQQGLSIFPNPGNGIFNISLDGIAPDNIEVKVYDLGGKLLYINKFANVNSWFEGTIDLSGFAPGIYQVHLKTRDALFHKALIIE